MAKEKQGNTSMTKWDAKFAELAARATSTEKNVGIGAFITLRAGRMMYMNNPVPNNQMDVVIIDHIIEYAYYKSAFDPDSPATPDCFAFGRDEATLAPHATAISKQNPTCHGCPQNEFGTADRGRGKACGNRRRLALMVEGDLDKAGTAEIAYMKIPVTSVKGWAGYVRQLADTLHRPPMAVVTTVKVEPDAKTQFKVLFTLKRAIDDDKQIAALFERQEKVAKEIDFPYTPRTDDNAGGGNGAGKNKGGKGQPAKKQKF